MIYRDPKCVYIADSLPKADLIAAWLSARDIPAQVMNRYTWGGFEGLTGLAPGVCHKGMEVWVIHPEQAAAAQALLETHAEQLAAERAERAARTGRVTAVCEECGQSSEFPAAMQGTVENCPHCRKWIDVPGPDDDWDGSEEFESAE
jgi:hypothetical protein